MRASLLLLLALALFTLPACEGGDLPIVEGSATAVFVLPRGLEGEAFFDLPWPNDIRRTEAGTIDVRSFPGVQRVRLLRSYAEVMSGELTGYSISAPVYFRFATELDAASLPGDAEASMMDDASVFVIAIDPASPHFAQRHPIEIHAYAPATSFWPGNAIAVRPMFGLPFAEATTYAAVVTRRVRAASGVAMGRSPDFSALLGTGGDAFVQAARSRYEPAWAALEEAGVSRDDVVSMAVFTTQDVTSELLAARDWLAAQPLPTSSRWRHLRTGDHHALVEGVYPSPSFQTGPIPFTEGGGQILFDDAGDPIVQEELEVRFALSVPRTEPPAQGFPLILYAHGTGGDYQSFARERLADDFGRVGIAVMGVDQIHHGTRNPGGTAPEPLVFNFANPHAFRDNARQSALDIVQQARAARAIEVPLGTLPGGVRIDPDHIYFYGHSQGGLNGPIFLAIDDGARGGVLSGAGGQLSIALVEKVEPLSIPELVRVVLGVRGDEHLVYEHPVHALLQTWTDVADPTHYVSMLFHEPRAGFAPKSILQTEGIADPYTPAASMEALATAARIPLLGPELRAVPALTIAGVSRGTLPARANVAGGQATAGLLQFPGGHFVAFDAAVRPRIVSFFETMIRDGVPTIE
ncbi:MAG: hypothetical protein KF901_04915 [Myxococcales bacterium]|nr:hypothetical protein [Myxococcales bacterium]